MYRIPAFDGIIEKKSLGEKGVARQLTDRELLYVKTVVEEKSLTKASQKLYIAQPSLSYAIQKIEESLDAKLFLRTSSGLKPTHIGHEYYKMAVEMLIKYDQFISAVKETDNTLTGNLSLGCSSRLSAMLSRIIPPFTAEYPFITFQILENTNRSTLKMLLHGDVNFALLHSDVLEKTSITLSPLPVAEDEFVLIVQENHPLLQHCLHPSDSRTRFPVADLNELKKYPIIRLAIQSNHYGKYEKLMGDLKINEMNVLLATQTMSTAAKLALEGVGVAICYLSGIDASVPKSCIMSLPSSINPAMTVNFVWLSDRQKTNAEILFYDYMKSNDGLMFS